MPRIHTHTVTTHASSGCGMAGQLIASRLGVQQQVAALCLRLNGLAGVVAVPAALPMLMLLGVLLLLLLLAHDLHPLCLWCKANRPKRLQLSLVVNINQLLQHASTCNACRPHLCCWVLHFKQLEDSCSIVCDSHVPNVVHQHL